MKKTMLLRVIFLCLMFILLFLRGTGPSFADEKVRIGYPSLSLVYWPVWVAYDSGTYKRNDLDVEMIVISGGPTLVAALVAKEVQFISVAAVTTAIAAARGASIKNILSLESKMSYQIWSLPEIKQVRDLKGKTISPGGGLGAGPHQAMSLVLKRSGLDPAKDVKQFPIRGSGSRIAALQAGQIHATVLNPPFTSVAKKAGLRLLVDTRQLGVDYQGIVVAVLDDLIKTNPNLAKRFTQATLQAADLMRKDKELAIRVGMKYSKRARDEVEEAYDLLLPAIPVSGKINLKGLASALEFAADYGIISRPLPVVQNFVDTRFAR